MMSVSSCRSSRGARKLNTHLCPPSQRVQVNQWPLCFGFSVLKKEDNMFGQFSSPSLEEEPILKIKEEAGTQDKSQGKPAGTSSGHVPTVSLYYC